MSNIDWSAYKNYDITKVSQSHIGIVTQMLDSNMSDDRIIKYLTEKLQVSVDIVINTLLFVKSASERW